MNDFSFNRDIKFANPELYVGPATTDQIERMRSNYDAYYPIVRNLPSHSAMRILTGHNFKPKKVISNYPATIVIWNDDTKTVVKCNKDDNYDLRTGILLCFIKKLFGNNNNYHKILYDAIDNAEWRFAPEKYRGWKDDDNED